MKTFLTIVINLKLQERMKKMDEDEYAEEAGDNWNKKVIYFCLIFLKSKYLT